jgi:outer membrane protein assembly factor BamA
MIRRICLRFGILVLLGTVCLSGPGYTQSQPCAETNPLPSAPSQGTKISIVNVEFQGENPLSDAQREELIKHIRQLDRGTTPEEPDSAWVDDALYPVKDALRNEGFFKVSVVGAPYLIRAMATEKLYVLRVTVESGPQYRLGQLRFASASSTPPVFPEALLRKQFQLQDGDVFDVSKIREGLEAVGSLYGSKGYIDATSEPDTTVDVKSSRIDLLIKVDQQQSYRLAKTRVRSLDASPQNELKLPQEIGDIFNPALWRDFFKENKLRFPSGVSLNRNMRTIRNTKDATLRVILDFRACPQNQPSDDW